MTEPAPKPRLLIADDSRLNLAELGNILAEYQLTLVDDGSKALKTLQSPPHPDLVILDVLMPDMGGFDLCRHIKGDARLRDIPVIFITGMEDIATQTTAFELGAVDFIHKPFSPAVVKARVKAHLLIGMAREKLARHNETLEKEVAARTSQLFKAVNMVREGSRESIFRLSRAAEYRDEDTGSHILRMGNYALALATRLGLGKEEAEKIHYTAPLHDVGKIGIPDRILLKPAKLDPEEWRIMKLHTVFGGKILAGSKSELIQLGEEVALTHHEKWDGTGYPRGLKDDDIPLSGQIVAIADVFDALTSRRPFKEAFPIDRSFAIIREGRGKHFAPDLVDAFFAIENQIVDIKSSYREEGPSLLFELNALTNT